MITHVIANDNEQIMIDPSDSRGQMYLRYTGPGQAGIEGPRYVRYTRSYTQCVLECIQMRSAVLQYLYLIIL